MPHKYQHPYRPSLFRHLAAMFYDLFLMLAVLFFAGIIAIIFNGGEAIEQGNIFFRIYLLAVSFLFYGWFWTHGGQTLGMRSWKIKLLSNNSNTISWRQSFIRFLAALLSWIPLGLGFWWQYLSKKNQSWPDKASNTYLLYQNK